MDKFFGYAGKIMDINLSEEKINILPLNRQQAGQYLSGVGFNARLLYDELKPGTDPLGPDNILVFNVGVLAGTHIPTACRTEASALSPATGLFGTANSGNYWGSELKFAGYDGIILRGAARGPCYISIHDDRVEILPAHHLWGKDAWETIKIIREEKGDHQIQVAVIGQAGENKVRFASIENGPYDAWARTGLGAVMGAKNLKAIAVRGNGAVSVARKKDFHQAVLDTRKAIYSSPFYGPFSKFGTMLITMPYQEFGILPGRNYQTGTLDTWMETRSRKLVPKYSNRGVACIACPIACAHWVDIKEGAYRGLKIKDMEVTPVIGFGAGCDINNLPAVAKLTEHCQRFGLDMVSASAAVAFAMELYQKGLIDKNDLGFELNWGNEEATFKLLEIIALRSAIGDILAEGTARACEKFPDSKDYAIHVKGLEVMLADPRGRWSTWTMGYLTNIRGGDHLRTRNPWENLKFNDNPVPYKTEKFGFPEAMFQQVDMNEKDKREIFDEKTRDVNIPKMSKWAEDLISAYNALGMCIRPPVLHTVGPTLFARLYSSLTGIDLEAADIITAGERIWNLQKMFNIRHGEKPSDSDYPGRFYKEPLTNSPMAGRTLDQAGVKTALNEYYTARGWDPETGAPTGEKLSQLGLK